MVEIVCLMHHLKGHKREKLLHNGQQGSTLSRIKDIGRMGLVASSSSSDYAKKGELVC